MFSNSITELFDTCFPLRTVKRGYKTRKPWLTEWLKKSIHRENRLYHRKQKSKKVEDKLLYKQYRNKLNRLLHISEQQHYDSLLKVHKNNLRNSWRIMKDIISKNKTSSSCSRFYINDGVNITNDKKVIAESSHHFSPTSDQIWLRKFHRIPNLRQPLWSEILTVWQYYQSMNLKLSISLKILKTAVLGGIQSRQKWWKHWI